MTDISERAMLCSLKIKGWTGRAQDRRVADDVADRYGAERDMGRYSKLLVAREALGEIKVFAGAARASHYANTLPWLDEGQRILPAAIFLKYMESQQELRLAWEREVKRFVADYPAYIRDAETRLGGLFVPTDYPDPAEIEARFSFEHVVEPLPTSRDFRVSLGKDHESRIRDEIEKRLHQAQTLAMKSLWQRCYDVAAHMSERLKLYHVDEEGKIARPFHDTLVGNVRELVDILPQLNLAEDPALARMGAELRAKLGAHEAQDLRDDEGLRASVAAEADRITKRLSEYL